MPSPSEPPELPEPPDLPGLPPCGPAVPDGVADALSAWIKSREQMQRPPDATAKVLAFVILAYRERLPFPTRPALAAHLGVSVPAIDVVLDQRKSTGDLRVVSRFRKGCLRNQVGASKFRLVIPTNAEMVRVVRDALAMHQEEEEQTCATGQK